MALSIGPYAECRVGEVIMKVIYYIILLLLSEVIILCNLVASYLVTLKVYL